MRFETFSLPDLFPKTSPTDVTAIRTGPSGALSLLFGLARPK